MKNKNIILTILGVIIIVISGIGISYFIYQNNLKNPINESYETNNENTNETNNENTNETNNENIDVYIKNHIIRSSPRPDYSRSRSAGSHTRRLPYCRGRYPRPPPW